MSRGPTGKDVRRVFAAGVLMALQLGPRQERVAALVERVPLAIAVAESLTGGELSATIARTPGSGDWFRGGLVAYSSSVKHDVLDAPPGPVVSAVAAAAMAEGACRLLGADLAIAVTGVAGPDEQDGQPPGTVWVGLHHRGKTMTRLERIAGRPEAVVDSTIERATDMVIDPLDRLSNVG